MATEMENLKMKKRLKKATSKDLTRLKQLQDGEPLSVADLAEAKRREEERKASDIKDFKSRQETKQNEVPVSVDSTLDQPPEHPRIAQIKAALEPFTKIEANDTRPDDFILFSRGVSITAGDIRKARKAMKM